MDYQIILDVKDGDKASINNVVQSVITTHGDVLGYPEDCDISVKQREVGEWVNADLTDDDD